MRTAGPIVFNYAYVVTLPSWINEMQPARVPGQHKHSCHHCLSLVELYLTCKSAVTRELFVPRYS